MNRATSATGWVRNPDGSPGYTWNPIPGCLNHDNGLCKGGGFPCYAYKLAHERLKQRYLANKNTPNPAMAIQYSDDLPPISSHDPFYPRFWEERLEVFKRRYKQLRTCVVSPKKLGIFVCDMSDLFGIGIPEEWTRLVLEVIRINAYDRFYLLTKQPQNLIKFSPFPDNCFVGVTATNGKMVDDAGYYLEKIEAKVKYLSFEPLLERIQMDMLQKMLLPNVVDWLIIGAQTKPYKPPEKIWVDEITEACKRAGIPYFLKDNLRLLLGDNLIQDMPKGADFGH